MKVVGMMIWPSWLGTIQLSSLILPSIHKWSHHTSLDDAVIGTLLSWPSLPSNHHCLTVLYIFLYILAIFMWKEHHSILSFKSEKKRKQDASSLTNWTSGTLGHLARLVWGALSDCPTAVLSGRGPRDPRTCTYHIQRPAALLDAVGVEHHSGPPEHFPICWRHNRMVRRLSHWQCRTLHCGPSFCGQDEDVLTS